MKTETLKKANDLKREIENLELVVKALDSKANNSVVNAEYSFGVSRDKYSLHYFPIQDKALNDILAIEVKKYISEKLPVLQKEFEELA